MFIFVHQKFSFRCLPYGSYEIKYTFRSISQFVQKKKTFIFLSKYQVLTVCTTVIESPMTMQIEKKRFWK